MKLQRLHIKNFKSIVDLEIVEPNPFTVFVGPNGSGKSNIFEALEFIAKDLGSNWEIIESLFGGEDSFLPFNSKNTFQGRINFDKCFALTNKYELIKSGKNIGAYRTHFFNYRNPPQNLSKYPDILDKSLDIQRDTYCGPIFDQFFYNQSRIFIKNIEKQKYNLQDGYKLSFSCNNLEKVLKRILQDETKREEIKEWLDLFIPGFENIEIVSSDLSGMDTLVMYEKGIKKPFTKDILSDGTYNILALLTAVYQSDEPQFLCIEEPENGLHPKVIRELVHFFREAYVTKGHYIWLNTHSQTLVSELTPEEIILVNKKKGETVIKQLKNQNLHGLRMDEAWLTAALGGGLPW
jgi:predicted ATPase